MGAREVGAGRRCLDDRIWMFRVISFGVFMGGADKLC